MQTRFALKVAPAGATQLQVPGKSRTQSSNHRVMNNIVGVITIVAIIKIVMIVVMMFILLLY